MFNFEDKVLTFFVNGEEVKIGPFSENYFTMAKDTAICEIMDNENFSEELFRLGLMTSEAISKKEGIPLYATHQSGGVAYEAWDGGNFYGYYTVFSDYAYLDSIDSVAYMETIKKAKGYLTL